MTVVPHPPYSPALVPCDFALFTATVTQLRWSGQNDPHRMQLPGRI
jgi:hypothetical protein